MNETIEPRRLPPTGERADTSLAWVTAYEKRLVSEHPLFVRLRSAPVDLSTIWVLMANLHESISFHFVRWLAFTISRVEQRDVASLLAKQLNDELGDGSADRVHSVLLQRFVDELAHWRPRGVTGDTFIPGRHLTEVGNQIFLQDDAYQALGAMVVGEIFAKQMDHCLGDEIRRQHWLSAESLVWLEIHETLEESHAGDSLELAALLPTSASARSKARRGAATFWNGLWRFLDDVDTAALQTRRSKSWSNRWRQ